MVTSHKGFVLGAPTSTLAGGEILLQRCLQFLRELVRS